MAQPSYAYACARISALSKSLFDRGSVKRMAEGSLGDALRMLQDARYGSAGEVGEGDVEKMIDAELFKAKEEVRELSPEPEITDLFLLENDCMNLKALVKARLLNTADVEWQSGGLYKKEELEKWVKEKDYSLLPPIFQQAMDALEKKLEKAVEPQSISIAIDRAYLKHALEATRKNPDFRQYFMAKADFDNVLTFLRVRAMGGGKEMLREVLLCPGGIPLEALLEGYEFSFDALERILKDSVCREALQQGLNKMYGSGSIGEVEKARDDYLMSLIASHRHDSQTLFPIVGYLVAREREAKAIRLIVTVKRNGLSETVIQERLVKLYG